MSVRLHLLVEGSTEEGFVNRVLAPHLGALNVFADARKIETSRRRGRIYRGGIHSYEQVAKDLQRWMKEDDRPDAWFTTMLDLYALPDEFPVFTDAGHETDPYRRISRLEAAFGAAIDHRRFIPYIQLHEFEALLLTEPRHLDWFFIEPTHQQAIDRLVAMAETYESPELIDDGPQTAPSKRIIAELPAYAGLKATVAPDVVAKIGLERLRGRCAHFGQWLATLESLSTAQDTG
jgi:hypothetical protein